MMTRRQFAGLLVLALGGFGVHAGRRSYLRGRELRQLGHVAAALLSHPELERDIGQFYLAGSSPRTNRKFLLRSLFPAWTGSAAPVADEMRNYLQAQMERDFAEGRTVRYEGWMISQTEAQLCALMVQGGSEHADS